MIVPETLDVQPPIGSGWDDRFCGFCGDWIEPDMEFVVRHFETDDPKMVDDCHTWCAVQDGYRLRWADLGVTTA
jgi:hypothetical protein